MYIEGLYRDHRVYSWVNRDHRVYTGVIWG